jgi:hypothetical protein
LSSKYFLLLAASFCIAVPAQAQDLEPRLYINLPIDQNFIAASYFYSSGDVDLSSSSTISDASIQLEGSILGYSRTLALADKVAKFDIKSSYSCIAGNALFSGTRRYGEECGVGDTQARFSYNFLGPLAQKAKEFRLRPRELVVGSSVQVNMPTGDYDGDKILNIGTNRWYIRPEIGTSIPLGKWEIDLALGAKIFTDNNDSLGARLQQDPLYNAQIHLSYDIDRRQWLSLNMNYFWGGNTQKDGINAAPAQKNSRLGLTYSYALNSSYIAKAFYNKGVINRISNDSDTAGLALIYRY